MVTANLSDAEPEIKSGNTNTDTLADSDGVLIIEAGFRGITALRIVATESSTQDRLCYALQAIRPILDLLGETLRALSNESVGMEG